MSGLLFRRRQLRVAMSEFWIRLRVPGARWLSSGGLRRQCGLRMRRRFCAHRRRRAGRESSPDGGNLNNKFHRALEAPVTESAATRHISR